MAASTKNTNPFVMGVRALSEAGLAGWKVLTAQAEQVKVEP
jgi:hypothetical protein